MNKVEIALAWFYQRIGKVHYSMQQRLGPRTYDCSSALYHALRFAGFSLRIPWTGNTETLFQEVGYLLEPIEKSQVKRGDIFISGTPGQSGGVNGHTGMAWSETEIIHCNAYSDGIEITPIQGWTGSPVHWYRIKNLRPAESLAIHVGSVVRVLPTAKCYQTGERIAQFVKGRAYPVRQIRIIPPNKRTAYLLDHIMSWVWKEDVALVA